MQPPPQGVAKINVDCSLSRNGEFGASAAVCRDHTGMFLGSSAMVFPSINDPTNLEARACREALALAQDLLIRMVIISCDCKTVVEEIKHGTNGRYGAIIREIRPSQLLFESYDIIFEGCEHNSSAHSLAKYSVLLDEGRHLWLGALHDPFCIPINITFQ